MPRHIFSLFLRSAMKYPFRTGVALLVSATSGVIGSFIGPLIIAQLLGKIQNGSVTLQGSWPLILLYAVTQIYGEILAWRLGLYCAWTMETAAQRDLYASIFRSLTTQSLSFHSDRFSGSLVSQTTKLIGAFERFWDTVIFDAIPGAMSIVAAVTILSFVFWQYALVLFVLSIVFIVSVIAGSNFLTPRNKEEAQASTAANGYIADVVSNVMAVKSYAQESREMGELSKKTGYWRGKSLASMRGFLTVSTGYASLTTLLNVCALAGAIWASQYHLISIAIVYLSITYTFTVTQQLWNMNRIMRTYNRVVGDAHDMTQILLLEPNVKDKRKALLHVTKGAIDFRNITFSHEEQDETLFTDFNLSIKGGEKIGLVGHSGSGKSTLTRLLLRFSDIDEGSINIDDQNIAEVTQGSLRENIAYVPQEPLLFHRSLRENIAYGRPEASEAEIYKAAKEAHALEFIEKLPEGFETTVGERGVKLSGGQRQRIAIARAILKDAPILVLDEATSALDSESELLIQSALTRLMKGRTSIVIAHRLSTVAKLDRIVVLENGRIIEQGSHEELLKHNGAYAKLWTHQSGGFIEP